jgi:hypothetical protein
VEADVRRRDLERLELQKAEGLMAGIDRLVYRRPRPEPLRAPERKVTPLNPEAENIIRESEAQR